MLHAEQLRNEEDVLAEKLKPAHANEAIVESLETGKIIGIPNITMLRGSPVFNSLTTAYDLLRKNPEGQLGREPIEPATTHSHLGRILVDLYNQSITRDALGRNRFTFEDEDVEDACKSTEKYFLKALGHTSPRDTVRFLYDNERLPNTLFYDDAGESIVYQKAKGNPTALLLKPVVINRTCIAAGTVCSVEVRHRDNYRENRFADALVARPKDDIYSLTPIRPSLFALPPHERVHAARNLISETIRTIPLESLAVHAVAAYEAYSTENDYADVA